MESIGNTHPEPMLDEWASQPGPTWSAVRTTMEASERTQQQDTYERLHVVATVTRQIFWTARPDGMSDDSPSWRAYTGQTRDDLGELGWMAAIHPEDRERTCTGWLQAVATRHFFETEYRIRRADGVYHPFLVQGVPLLDAAGNIREWVGVCTDISKRKYLEERLQASEAHFRASFEHAPVGIGQTTRQGRWVRVNQHLCDMLGYTHEEMLALRFQDVTHPDDVDVSNDRNDRLWAGLSPPYSLEKRYVRKDGAPVWVKVTISLIRTQDGTPSYTVAIVENISQRKQLEEDRACLLAREQQARAQAEATALRLRAMQRLTDTALEHLPLEDLLSELLERIREVMAVDATTILLRSQDGQFLTVRASSGLEDVAEGRAQLRVPFGKGIAGRVTASQKPLIVDDLSKVEVFGPFLQEKLCSLMSVPLMVKDRVIGAIHVGTAQPHHFSQDDVQLLEMVAYRIALAIDHAHLFQAERHARAEAAARASQLEATIEAMTEGVGIYNPQGDALLTNQSSKIILGIDDPDRFRRFTSRLLAERFALLHCRDKDGNPYPPERLPLMRALQGEVVPDAESEDMFITALDGYERSLSSTASPIRDAEGQIAGAVYVYRDVTERRLLERRTHDALDALLEMAQALVTPTCGGEGFFAQDPTTGASILAQRLAELTARVVGCDHVGIAVVDPESTQLRPLAIVSPDPAEQRQWWNRRRYAPRLGESSDPTWTTRLTAGEAILLETQSPPFHEPHPFHLPIVLIAPMCIGNHLVGLLSLGHERAEHVYTPQEIALAKAVARLTAFVIERDHLLQQREEAQASVMAIREANRQLETFLGMASHELKTPLTSILMGQEMLQRRVRRLRHALAGAPADADRQVEAVQALVDTTHQQAGRLNRLVNDLLDTSRIQAGRLTVQITPMDLAIIARSVIEEQRQVASERRILLHLPSRSVPVLADAERIGQVVTNYLTNALKYSPEDRPVTVGLNVQDQQAHLWVRDQGPGIPQIEQERVWERFHRVPGIEIQSGSGIGLGIGLYISKTIIDQHGGQVGVQSTRGAGATFWFTLPLESADTRPNTGTAELPDTSPQVWP